MPIAASDLIKFGSASRPEDDTSTTGGAIDLTARPALTQLSADAVIALISDNAGDTQNVTITGRDSGGAIVTDTFALTGTSEAVGTQSFERVHKVVLASAATGTVTVRQGTGGATIATINAGETESFTHFQRAASESSATSRYEKVFWKNNHGTLTLTSAEVTLTADPNANIQVGVAPSVDDTATVTNRETAPATVTFVDDSTAQAVPGGQLAAGEAIGVWIRLDLASSEAAQKSTFTTQIAGQTT